MGPDFKPTQSVLLSQPPQRGSKRDAAEHQDGVHHLSGSGSRRSRTLVPLVAAGAVRPKQSWFSHADICAYSLCSTQARGGWQEESEVCCIMHGGLSGEFVVLRGFSTNPNSPPKRSRAGFRDVPGKNEDEICVFSFSCVWQKYSAQCSLSLKQSRWRSYHGYGDATTFFLLETYFGFWLTLNPNAVGCEEQHVQAWAPPPLPPHHLPPPPTRKMTGTSQACEWEQLSHGLAGDSGSQSQAAVGIIFGGGDAGASKSGPRHICWEIAPDEVSWQQPQPSNRGPTPAQMNSTWNAPQDEE